MALTPPGVNSVQSIEDDLTLHLPQQLNEHLNFTAISMSSHCHHTNCAWLSLPSLHNFTGAPPLLPESEISGIGVILGFAITAYLTLLLLVINYVFAFDPHKWSDNGRRHTNPLDFRLLGFIRKAVKWRPTRRLEYSLERVSAGPSSAAAGAEKKEKRRSIPNSVTNANLSA